jgi:hypothetical protein
MSRKHKHKKNPGTAPAPEAPAVATATAPAAPVVSEPAATPAKAARRQERTWLEEWGVRLSRKLGSLQMAVALLSLFAFVLAIGTMVESWYSARIAQELVYRAWWFTLLLGLLGVNIFFAAAKKWPWKRHQTGFLITHVGLLTMLAGGILTSLSGTDAQMQVIDTSNASLQRRVGAQQTSNEIFMVDDRQIILERLSADNRSEKRQAYDFAPGSFVWHTEADFDPDYPLMLQILKILAYPLPHFWAVDLDRDTRLEILQSYPHSRVEPYSPAEGGGRSFPAVRIELVSPRAGALPPTWLAMTLGDTEEGEQDPRAFHQGPAMAEILGHCPTPLLSEFLEPPVSPGKMGQLVLMLNGQKYPLNVAEALEKVVPLGTSGYQAKVTRYFPTVRSEAVTGPATEPSVEFELITPQGKVQRYRVFAKLTLGLERLDEKGKPTDAPDPTGLKWWYHQPDYRSGQDDLRGLVQLVQDDAGKLYYRSFHNVGGTFLREASGPLKQGDTVNVWSGMNWRLTVLDHLPEAVTKSRLVPENARPGLQRDDLHPALRARLRHSKDATEFWLQEGQTRHLSVGPASFKVGYGMKRQTLPFTLKLLRAEQTVDNGTSTAATFTSIVQLSDPGDFSHPAVPKFLRGLTNALDLTNGGEEIVADEQVITMNAPLNHRGFKVYQSNYNFMGFDGNEKPVNFSGFTVGRDPGMGLKYLGSTMLALGIFTMYYMKAYPILGGKRRTAVA